MNKKQRLIEQRTRVKTLAELLIDGTSTYITSMQDDNMNAYAGYEFAKNSNASRTALKAQITILRNELLKLSKELE
jgi:hypothetical protein